MYLNFILNLKSFTLKSGDIRSKNKSKEEIPADAPIKEPFDPLKKRKNIPPVKIPTAKSFLGSSSPSRFFIAFVVNINKIAINIKSNIP